MRAMKVWRRVLCCMLAIPVIGSAGNACADVGKNVPLRRCWAVLVGVNYTDRTDNAAFPPLDNAAHDAVTVSEHLLKYYEGYSETRIRVLTDPAEKVDLLPTRSNIDSAITWLEQHVQKGDSVLLFFAGHAFPSNAGGAVFLPRDYQLKEGSSELAETSAYRLGQLVEKLQTLECKQRLLILDCCYAGAVYDRITPAVLGGQEKPQSMYFDALSLEESPAFQIIVSARATQRADDGGARRNSKFTYHLVNALKFHGAKRSGTSHPYVLARELVDYVRLRFDDDESQRPDCRNLYHTGDFFFRPRHDRDLFDEFRMPSSEQSELLAVVASQQGHWWFEEMPWCIPGLRKRIFDEVLTRHRTKKRSRSQLAPVFSPKQMREVAREILKRAETAQAEGTIQGLRMRHAELLFDAQENGKLQDALVQIESELTALLERSGKAPRGSGAVAAASEPPIGARLEAVDLHLLAVVRHALQEEDGQAAYERAIRAYREQAARTDPAGAADGTDEREESGGRSEIYHAIPRALCHADYGEFLQQIGRQPQQAVKQYRAAIEIVRDFVPERAPREQDGGTSRPELVAKLFSVFVLTRMADSHLFLNHWDDANQSLEEALVHVQDVAAGHYLEAHVHRRRAWAQIMQWRMSQAIRSFGDSNAVLDRLFEQERQDRIDNDVSPVGTPRSAGAPPRWNRLPEAFIKSTNHAAKLAYLHNLHGIAMARRFLGDTTQAAREYRWLSSEVEHAIVAFRQTTVDRNLERHFVLRIVNTLERLGDCNLFGDPMQRQLGEAVDDYRRALQYVYVLRQWEKSPDLRVRTSDRWMGVLLYKQALALSVPSPVRDTTLALEMCEEADKLFAKQQKTATDTWQALGKLATATVRLLDTAGHPSAQAGSPRVMGRSERPSQDAAASPDLSSLLKAWKRQPVDMRRVAADQLRTAIIEYRDVTGLRPHRDQLEVCLFAAKVLIEHGGDRSRFRASADSELLHSFCRMALFRDTSDSHGTGERSEARTYLRPYYDAIFRSRSVHAAESPVVVKELIELQSEATSGRRHHKQEKLEPVLAIYVVREGGDCYLLWDEPAAPGVCVSLGQYYGIASISQATSISPASGIEKGPTSPIMVPAAGMDGDRAAVSASGALGTGSIPLPRQIRERMEALAARGGNHRESGVAVIWRPDPRLAVAARYQPIVARVDSATGSGSSTTTTFKLIWAQDAEQGGSRNCPFRLPHGIALRWGEP